MSITAQRRDLLPALLAALLLSATALAVDTPDATQPTETVPVPAAVLERGYTLQEGDDPACHSSPPSR